MELTDNQTAWRKVDLHIHSKYSCESNAKMEIKTIFDKAAEKGLQMISITDHNNVDGLNEILAVADEYKEKVVFLPGIEFKTDKGDKSVHAIAVFPQEIKQNGHNNKVNKEFLIENVLAPLSLTKAKIEEAGCGSYEKGLFCVAVDFEDMAKKVHEWQGVVIVHATKSNGIEQEMDHCRSTTPTENELLNSLGTTKENLMRNHIDACELRNWSSGELRQQDFYIKKFTKPSVVFSDAHTAEQIGTGYSWLKMDHISFEGLRQILFEPKLRVTLAEFAPSPNYQRLVSISTSGGYYKNSGFAFHPELNVLIGPRGSGKSVVIDLIKFVLGKYNIAEKETQNYFSRMYDLLRFQNEVTAKFIDRYGSERNFSRVLNLELDERNQGSYIDKSSNVPEDISDYFEVYGQGELKNLLKRSEAKLKLLDELGATFPEKENIVLTIEKLRQNAQFQIKLSEEISPLLEQFNEYNSMIKTAEDIKSKLEGFDIEAYLQRENRNKHYELLLKKHDEILQIYYDTKQKIQKIFQFDIVDDTCIKCFQEIFLQNQKILLEHEFYIEQALEESKANFNNIGFPEFGIWKDYYNEENNKFIQHLKDNNIENIIEETNRLKSFQTKILEFESTDAKRLFEKTGELNSLQEERNRLLSQYHQNIHKLREKRCRRCDHVNHMAPSSVIRLSIDDKQDKQSLEKYLKQILTGKNIRSLDEQIRNIVSYTQTIGNLLELLKTKNIDQLTKELNITSNTASVLISTFSDDIGLCNYPNVLLSPVNNLLFKLELLSFEDIVHIQALDPTTQKYKDIKRFSNGQQCSFLLSLLIASSQNPLIVDQPEDDLDWNYLQDFISKLIEAKVSENGSGRQFIFATHNQNITVLADSEKIFYLSNKPTESDSDVPSGEIKACGGLDRLDVKNAVLSLEGGKDAFNKRKMKYGI